MGDFNNPRTIRKRTVIRRLVPERLADFDEQVWPVNLAILVFAGFVTGIVLATTENFFDPRPLYNGVVRLGVIAVLVALLLWSSAHVRAPTVRRIQFCVILSLFLHLLLAVLLREQYLQLIAFIREYSSPGETDVEEVLTLPDYSEESLEQSGGLEQYTRPVQTLPPKENPSADEVPDRARPQKLSAPEGPVNNPEPLSEKPPVAIPPRTRDSTRDEAAQQETAPLSQAPAPASEISADAPLEQPPEREAPNRVVTPRDEIQREITAPQKAPQPIESRESPSVELALPARKAVEMPPQVPPSAQVPRSEENRQPLASSPPPQIVTPAPRLAVEPRGIQPSEVSPRRAGNLPSSVQPSGNLTEPRLADLTASRPTLREQRYFRSEGAIGPINPEPLAAQEARKSEETSIANAAELASLPHLENAGARPRTPSDSGDVSPRRDAGIASSAAPIDAGADVMAVLSAPQASLAQKGRMRESISSQQLPAVLGGPSGGALSRTAPPEAILGSSADFSPAELEPRDIGQGNLRGRVAQLESRPVDVWRTPGSIGSSGNVADFMSSGQIGRDGGSLLGVLGSTNALGSGPTRGLGAARDQPESTSDARGVLAGGHGMSRSSAETGSPILGSQVSIETGVPERGAGRHLRVPGERPEALDVRYGKDERELGLVAGVGTQGNLGDAGNGPPTAEIASLPSAGYSGVKGLAPPSSVRSQFSMGEISGSNVTGSGTGTPEAGLRQSIGDTPRIESQVAVADIGTTAGPGTAQVGGGLQGRMGDGPARSVVAPPLLAYGSQNAPSGENLLGISSGLPGRRSLVDVSPPVTSGLGDTRAARSVQEGPSSQVLRDIAEIGPSEAFAQRNPEKRAAHAAEFGGTKQTEEAVEKGLEFLAKVQFPDGHWALHRLPDHVPDPQKSFQTGTMHGDTAATGLSLLAFLGAGYTHQGTKYRDTVARGLRWLVANQLSDGRFFRDQTDSNLYTRFYGHGFATIAICEAYGMTRDPALREPAARAIDFIVKSQSPEFGGWRYESRKETDTSVTGWQLMALKSAQMAGLPVPETTLAAVSRWLDQAQVDEGARYVYSPYAGSTSAASHLKVPNRAMTAEGLLMRIYLGWGPQHRGLQRGAAFLAQNLPSYGTSQTPLRDAYYWYYATQVMFQMQGDLWNTWNQATQKLLLTEQVQTGPWAGSWDPTRSVPDRWGKEGGRLYVTAMHLLILEVYYRHLPLFKTLAQNN